MDYIKWKINQLQRYVASLSLSNKVILEVEKVTTNTYAGEITYENEQYVCLTVYPKKYGTVSITYGDLTKTITDTSGIDEPNGQYVYFGTLYGVADEIETPMNGVVTIDGDFYAVGCGWTTRDSKSGDTVYCITRVVDLGSVTEIPLRAFGSILNGCTKLTSVIIPETVESIEEHAFSYTSISEIVIPKKVTEIGYNLFWQCSNLTSVTFEDPIGWKGEPFSEDKPVLESVDFLDPETNASLFTSTYLDYKFTKL